MKKNEHNETNEDLDKTTDKLNKSHSGVQFRASYERKKILTMYIVFEVINKVGNVRPILEPTQCLT